MQRNLKLNPHGIVGGLLIILMFGIAFFLGWNVNWLYFSVAVVLYSLAAILFTRMEEAATTTQATGYSTTTSPNVAQDPLIFRWLLGCHLALLFFAVGLFFSEPAEWFFLASGILCGPAISFLLLRTSGGKNSLHLQGLVALLLIILMVGVAFLYIGKHVGEVYAAVYSGCVRVATLVYIVAIIYLKPGFLSVMAPPRRLRLQLGCHLAFILLIVGFVLPLKDVGSVIAFFIVSIAVGLSIPYLLLRGS